MDTFNNNQPSNQPAGGFGENPLPSEPQTAFPEGVPSGGEGGSRKILAVAISAIAVLVLITVGYFAWKTFRSVPEPQPDAASMQNPQTPPLTTPPQSPPPASDEIGDIEKELNNLNVTGLDSQFQQDFSEIDKL